MLPTDVERWMRNAGKGKSLMLSMIDDKFLVEIIGERDLEAEGVSSSLPQAYENAMQELRVGRPKAEKYEAAEAADPQPANALASQFPLCPDCGRFPVRVWSTGEANCACGIPNWKMTLHAGMQVKTSTGDKYEFDGTSWGPVT